MSADPKETPCHASDPPDHSPDRCGRGGSRGTGRVRVLDLATQIKVAQQATSQSTDPEARALADTIVAGQTTEIDTMQKLLQQ